MSKETRPLLTAPGSLIPRYRLTSELKNLTSKLEEFEQERLDLETILLTTTEHGDLIETALFNELRQFRLRLEELEQEHKGLEREKTDLEIALETVTETTDLFQKDLLRSRHILEQEVNKRTEELALQNKRLQAEIQERKRIEADLQLAASVFRTSREGIVILNAQRRVISINPAFTDLTGYLESEMLDTDLSCLQAGQHSQTFFHKLWEAVHFVGYWSGEVWHRRKTEEIFPAWFSLTVIYDENNNIINYIGILADNTYQRRSEERAYYFAHYDVLTGLSNRNLFQDRLEQFIKRAVRENHRLSLLVIDLDSFKDINEVFGHQVGDQLLKEIGQRLIDCLEGKDDLIARLGSDEFVMAFDELPADDKAVQITLDKTASILTAIQRPLQLLDQELSVSACGGIAFYPKDGENLVELLRRANNNLYEAKRQGHNNYHFLAGPINAQTKKRLTLQHHLRYVLERNELFLLYQPQVDIHTRKIAGVEALLRWQHPEFGLVSPSEFIPIVEDIGLIVPVGEWVLSAATRQAQSWLNQGLSPVRMAVNLSMRQFNDPLLVQRVHHALVEANLAPHYLELEITESLAMQDAEKTVTTLRQLKQLGLFLALDDFGTGYSSLSYLSQFPLDVLKIDAAFIGKIQTPNGANLVSAITTLARSLRMDVIAEGVETKAQLACLQRYACDYVQGFYFYKPMPADELTVLLQQQG